MKWIHDSWAIYCDMLYYFAEVTTVSFWHSNMSCSNPRQNYTVPLKGICRALAFHKLPVPAKLNLLNIWLDSDLPNIHTYHAPHIVCLILGLLVFSSSCSSPGCLELPSIGGEFGWVLLARQWSFVRYLFPYLEIDYTNLWWFESFGLCCDERCHLLSPFPGTVELWPA